MENGNNSNDRYGKVLARWQISEYTKYRRTFLWYFLLGAFGLGMLVYAVWTTNFLFAVIIVIIATIITIHERQEPNSLDFTIYEDGIMLDNTFLSYKMIKKFWIIYEPPHVKNLYFHIDRLIRPELSIPLINMNPVYIRRILLKYLQEDLDQKDISFDDQLGRMLKL